MKLGHCNELARFVAPQRACSYVPTETASLEYRICSSMSAARYLELLRRGWRRHGAHFFRPACPVCRKCRSLRVDVARFRPTKSQRRALRRNADVELVVRRPTVTPEHVRLYNAWHEDMTERRGWSPQRTSIEDYTAGFLIGEWEFAREMLYYRTGRLIGVGLVDLVEDALSSVYFYHDPDWRKQGPGTFSALREIELAAATDRRYVYMGYWIRECPSMAYKSRFAPHEILEAYVADDEEPRWRRPHAPLPTGED